MKAFGGVGVYVQALLISVIVQGEWLASRPCCFTTFTHGTWGWVGSRTGFGDVTKVKWLPYRESNPNPSIAQLLSQYSSGIYIMRYPGSKYVTPPPFFFKLTHIFVLFGTVIS
jgi:hypothetical protein